MFYNKLASGRPGTYDPYIFLPNRNDKRTATKVEDSRCLDTMDPILKQALASFPQKRKAKLPPKLPPVIKSKYTPDLPKLKPVSEPDTDNEEKSAMANKLHGYLVKQASLLMMDSLLTKVAAALPMTKRSAFRALQANLSNGYPLVQSIKMAFPHLSGEERGVFALTLCKSALDDSRKVAVQTPQSYNDVSVKNKNSVMRKCAEIDRLKVTPTGEFLGNLSALERARADNGEMPPLQSDNMHLDPVGGLGASLSKSTAPTLRQVGRDEAPAAPTDSSAPADSSAPTVPSPSMLSRLAEYAKDPRVLALLAAGGLGGYGLYRAMSGSKKKKNESN
jgi:hypothetical protein